MTDKKIIEMIRSMLWKFQNQVKDFDDLVGYCIYRYYKKAKKYKNSIYLKGNINSWYVDYQRAYGKYFQHSKKERIGYWRFADFEQEELEEISYEYSSNIDLEKALSCLSPKQKKIIRLHYFYGKKECEIAKLYKVTPGAINMQKKKALERMRNVLQDYVSH